MKDYKENKNVLGGSPQNGIAIVGMGCVFPDAPDLQAYWENIISCRYSVREIPHERWNPQMYYDPYAKQNYMSHSKLAASVEGFVKDPLKFRIPPVSAPFIDRMQFMMLEAAHQALLGSGCLKGRSDRSRTAVFVGSNGKGETVALHDARFAWKRYEDSLRSAEEFRRLPANLRESIISSARQKFCKDLPEVSEDTCGGVFGSIIASRINNCFDLGGTSLVLDAACASSLAAVDMAMRGLSSKEYDMALAGGIDGKLDIQAYIYFSSLGAISDKGSFPFDQRADGFILGEGAGMIALKRLEDALRDDDKIYAVIRSVGTSSDGRSKGITAPDVKGQIRALERTYEKLPFTPDTVSMVEAHGTGTWMGDKAEMSSLTEFYGRYTDKKQFIGLGSVKSMIGHLKSAAGIAGLIKTAMALDKKILPPTINCENPRKDISWDDSPFYLLTESCAWDEYGIPRRAAVDSFGFGGINYHAVFEEAPAEGAGSKYFFPSKAEDKKFPADVILFSASSRTELIKNTEKAIKDLKNTGRHDAIVLTDTASVDPGFNPGPVMTVVASGKDELLSNLRKGLAVIRDPERKEFFGVQGIYFSDTPLRNDEKIAFLFPGLGSSYLDMGGDLPAYFPFAGEIFSKVDRLAAEYTGSSMMDLLICKSDTLPEKQARLEEMFISPDYNHPVMVAMGAAILEIFKRAGIKPDMTAGHSLGEYMALYASGAFDLETTINVTAVRGMGIARECFSNGAMLSIGLPEHKVVKILDEEPGFVRVANKNCPAQTVVSGGVPVVERLMKRMEKAGVTCKKLPASSAYHTSLLEPCVGPFRKLLEEIRAIPPVVPVQCNLTGRFYETKGDFGKNLSDILTQHMVRPVEFISNVESLYKEGARLFIEIGPGSTLSSFVDNILADRPHWTVQTNSRQRSSALGVIHSLALCRAKGLAVDFNAVSLVSKNRTSLHSRDRKTEAPLQLRNQFSPAGPLDGVNIDIRDRIIDIISEKSGYPAKIIDIDYDVEAELGLDSIKQVEIIRAAAREFNIDFGEDPRSQRYRMTTPRKLIKLCEELIGEGKGKEDREGKKEKSESFVDITEDVNTDCRRWVSRMAESSFSGPGDYERFRSMHVLLAADKKGIARRLKRKLRESGAVVTVVDYSNDSLTLPGNIDVLINMRSYAEDDKEALEDCIKWWARVEKRSRGLLNIAKDMSSVFMDCKDRHIRWFEVTSLGGKLGADIAKTASARAGISFGVARCLALENADNLTFRVLDFAPGEADETVASSVYEELAHSDLSSEIGYFEGKRYEIRWKREDISDDREELGLDSNSVVLAIGGARGITADLCRNLAERTGARFAIVGRSEVKENESVSAKAPVSFKEARRMIMDEIAAAGRRIVPAEIDDLAWHRVWKEERAWNMRRLEEAAGEAGYYRCDIIDSDNVNRLICNVKKRFGRIDLVMQGAGDLIEKSIIDLDPDDFMDKMRSKALGTACLLGALKEQRSVVFVNFSSVAGRWGNKGQAAYATAHELAAILVSAMRGKYEGRWINIFFGAWLNKGMIRVGPVMERLKAKGADFITQPSGSDFFFREINSGKNMNTAFCGKGSIRSAVYAAEESIAHAPVLFSEDIEITGPGRAQGSRVFDPLHDRIVAEHITEYKEPILPGVVCLEMIALTAQALNEKDYIVTKIEDIVFSRPGVFPGLKPRQFISRVKVISQDDNGIWVSGEILSIFREPGTGRRKEVSHVSCRMRFGRRSIEPAPALLLVESGLGSQSVDAKPLWKTVLRGYRRGMYRTVSSFLSVTAEGVSGEISAPAAPEAVSHAGLGNLMLIDGLADIVNLSTSVFYSCESSLVAGIDSIRFFGLFSNCKKYFCRTLIKEVTPEGIVCDVEALDERKKVKVRITGIRRQRIPRDNFHLPEPIWESVRENPVQKDVKLILGYERLVLTWIDISLLDSAVQSDEQEILDSWLSPDERLRYVELTVKKRKLEWLAGRLASKAAIRMYMDPDAADASSITIRKRLNNSPYIELNKMIFAADAPHISISHNGDIAAALVSEDDCLGIDVQKINRSILDISENFCFFRECDTMHGVGGLEQEELLTFIWCAKESGRKAVGCNNCTMKQLILQKAELYGRYIISDLYHPNTGHVRSVMFRNENYVYAVSIMDEREGNG